MTPPPTNPDISVRGGIINVPHSTTPTHPPRHQPDTPINKKFKAAAAPKPKRRTKTKTTSPPTPPPEEGQTNNESAPPS